MDPINRRQFVAGTLATALVPAALESAPVPREPGTAPAIAPRFEEPPLPAGVYARLGSARFRYSGRRTGLWLTPNGKYLVTEASVGAYLQALLWEVATGRCITDFGLSRVQHVKVVTDEQIISVLKNEETGWCILKRDLRAGNVLKIIALERKEFVRAEFDPQGRRMVLTNSAGVVCCSCETGETIWQMPADGVLPVPGLLPAPVPRDSETRWDFSGDGSRIAIQSGKHTQVFDAANGIVIAEFIAPSGVFLSHRGTIAITLANKNDVFDETGTEAREVAMGQKVWVGKRMTSRYFQILPDDTAVVRLGENRFVLQSLKTGLELRKLPISEADGVLVTPDRKTAILELADGSLKVIDLKTGLARPQSTSPAGRITGLQYLSNSQLVGHFVEDRADCVFWNPVSRMARPLDILSRTLGETAGVAVAPNGRRYAVYHRTCIRIFDAGQPGELANFEERDLLGLLWMTDTRLLGYTSKGFLQYEFGAAKQSRIKVGLPAGNAIDIAASGDGRTAFALIRRNPDVLPVQMMLARCDVSTGRWRRFDLNVDYLRTLHSSADGRRLVALGVDGQRVGYAVVLNGETGAVVKRVNDVEFEAPCILSPDGRCLALGREFTTKTDEVEVCYGEHQLLEVITGARRRKLSRDDDTAKAFSPNGRTLATAHDEAPVYIWDIYGERTNSLPKPDAVALRMAWRDLDSLDAEVGFRAICLLVQHPTDALPMLAANLKPAEVPDQNRVRKAIEELADREYRTREAAERELASIVNEVRKQLQAAFEAGTHGPEANLRLERLLNRTPLATPQIIRAIRAHEILERIGTPAAKAIVEASAKGAAEAEQTKDAVSTSGRWAHGL